MVLPWLLVGAAAALEGHRRGAPVSDSSAKVNRLQEVEKELRNKQKELITQLQVRVMYIRTRERVTKARRDWCG